MAESSGEKPSQPQFEVPKLPEDAQEKLLERAIEQKQVSEGSATKQTPKFQPPVQAPPPVLATPQQTVSTDDKSKQKSVTSGLTARDVDLIEKEWVDRAKSIVAKTRDDPYKQKSEISKVKAEYIKKRYDKTIPMDERSTP